MVPLAANATPTSHTTVIPATARMSRLDPSFVLCPFHGLMSCSFLKCLDSNMIFELGKKDGARQSYSRARSIHDGLKQGQHPANTVTSPFALLLLGVLGQVTEKVDGVPDVFFAQFLAPWFHDHGFGPDPFLDTLEDVRVAAAVFPFAGDQVGRGRTLGRGRPVAFALQPVATGAVLRVDGPAGLDRIGGRRNGVLFELEPGRPKRELAGRPGCQAETCYSHNDTQDERTTYHGTRPLSCSERSIYRSVPDFTRSRRFRRFALRLECAKIGSCLPQAAQRQTLPGRQRPRRG